MLLRNTSAYVLIPPTLENYPPDLLWLVTPGVRIRLNQGIQKGEEGWIVGHGRSRRAQREFVKNYRQAVEDRRTLTDQDYECLIEAEGPLVLLDGARIPDWYPGNAAALLSQITVTELDRCLVDLIHEQELRSRCILHRDHQKLDLPHRDVHWHHAEVLVHQSSIREAKHVQELLDQGLIA